MKWKELLDSCSSESIRIEFLRMCRILLCIRVADCLGIDKVMLADSSDFVVNCTLSSLAFGRGLFLFFISFQTIFVVDFEFVHFYSFVVLIVI